MIEYEVQQIKFEQIYIEKLKNKALKTYKIRDWLSLLNAYQENSDFIKKDQTIKQMHQIFVLREEFWIKEIERKLNKDIIGEDDVEFAMMALEDGFYEKAACIIYKRLFEQIVSSKKGSEGTLRTNYILAKVQHLISMFVHKSQNPCLEGLRTIYIALQNEKKIRQTFYRLLKTPYENIDIIYDLYQDWEQNQEYLKQGSQLYEIGKNLWEDKRYNLEIKNYKGLHPRILLTELEEATSFDAVKFLQGLQELETDMEKVWFLRRVCFGRHELAIEYLEKIEAMEYIEEAEIVQLYKKTQSLSLETELPYLRFLVRRFNKHIYSSQPQQYNSTWGDKVQFFRQEISSLIEKPRLTQRIKQSIKQSLYNYWIDVETSLIQDKSTICQLFETLLKEKPTRQLFNKYAKSLIKLGYYKDAKNVFKRSCDSFKYDYEAQKEYENYISVYGNVHDAIQLRKCKSLGKMEMIPKDAEILNEKKDNQNIKLLPKDEFKRMEKQANGTKNKNQKKQLERIKSPEKKYIVDEFQQQENSKIIHQRTIDPQPAENEAPKKKLHTDSANTLFIKNFPANWKEDNIRDILKYKDKVKQIRMIEKFGQPKDYCYVQMQSEEAARFELEENEHQKEFYIAVSKPPGAYSEEQTLFLCALPETTTHEKVKKLFERWSKSIVDIRLKVNEKKNIAYVDFNSIDSKKEAFEGLKGLNLMIDKKRVLLRECMSHKVQQKKRNKVIILKNLSFSVKESDIQKFFQGKSIEQIYLPKKDGGKSKGYAFVEFQNENDYFDAINLRKGCMRSRHFSIQKSDRQILIPKLKEKDKSLSNKSFSDIFK